VDDKWSFKTFDNRQVMRLVLLSDTHGLHADITVPAGDVLIHAGDMSTGGEPEEIRDFGQWLQSQPHKHKIVIAGNHDFLFEDEPAKAQALLPGCTYLQDSSVVIDSVTFYGSPYTPRFFDWAFNQDRGPVSAARWAKIPNATDVLITHGPPFGILDRTTAGEFAGCHDLLAAIQRIKPRLHVFGHIHEGAGMHRAEAIGTTFVNASALGAWLRVDHAPIVFDL
jgi:Icc-related predicted phosphoesterase